MIKINDKKGIELSTSFLVILTLSAVALIFAFFFLSKFISTSKNMEEAIDTSYDIKIKSYLKDAIAIIVPKIVEIKKEKIIYVGVKNAFNVSKDFKINFTIYMPKISENILTPTQKQINNLKSYEKKIVKFILNSKKIKKINQPIILIGTIYYWNGTDWRDYYSQSIKIINPS